MLLSYEHINKKRWIEFEFQTTSTSSAWQVPKVSESGHQMNFLIEVYLSGVLVKKEFINSNFFSSTPTIDLSAFVGTKLVKLKCLSSLTNNGFFNVDYMGAELTRIGSEFDKLRYINIFDTTINSISSTLGYAENFIISGTNTISSIPATAVNLKTLRVYGQNTIASIPSTLVNLEELTIDGLNTISSIPSLPNLKQITIHGNNTISDISHLTSIDTRVDIRGNNTLSGSLNDIMPYLANISSLILLWGSNLTYTGTLNFHSNLNTLWLDPAIGSDLNTNGAMISSIIQDLDASLGSGGGTINLTGNCALAVLDTPTINAISSLIGKNYIVNINP